jgi:hypothetical protein
MFTKFPPLFHFKKHAEKNAYRKIVQMRKGVWKGCTQKYHYLVQYFILHLNMLNSLPRIHFQLYPVF